MRTFYNKYVYRIHMKIAHYFNYCHMEKNIHIQLGYINSWCHWCGTRDKRYILHDENGHICDNNCILNS